MQRVLSKGNSFAVRNQKSESVGNWCNIRAYSRPTSGTNSDISKCKQSLCPIPRSIDALSVEFSYTTLTLILQVPSQLSTLKFIFYGIKTILAIGRLIKIDKVTFENAN